MPVSSTVTTRNFSLSALLRWWGAELRALLPLRLRRWLGLAQERWIVHLNGTRADVLRRFDADEPAVAVAGFDLSAPDAVSRRLMAQLQRVPPQRLTLRLPADAVLRKRITLPEATLENLRDVLGFEMDRHTPFKSGDVYFDCRVLGVDSALRQIQVELTAVPRAVADAALQRLRALGVTPRALDADGAAGPDWDLLRGGEQGLTEPATRHWSESLLALTVVALLAAVVALPLSRAHRQNTLLLTEVNAARRDAEALNDRIREADVQAGQSRFLDERRRAAPTALALIDALSAITPDDTWVSLLSLNGRELSLHGESVAATKLIGLYEDSPLFGNVRFRAQLTQNRMTNRERFDIAAEISAQPGEAP